MISYWRGAFLKFSQNRAASFGLCALIFLVLMALIGPYLTPYTYNEIHLELKNQAPSMKFWFGTDELGRDMFTRLFWGARISLTVGISAALIDLLIGVIYGSFSAKIAVGTVRVTVAIMVPIAFGRRCLKIILDLEAPKI